MDTRIIKIDQAIHGYARGHKELASSIELDDRSRATMLMMSDLLAVSDLQPDETYLTVYPLKSASRHVIARTWPAGRAYRPGSVWTHSLILDYQSLTLIHDLMGLMSLFERPSNLTGDLHLGPILIEADGLSSPPFRDDGRASIALEQLYGSHPRELILLPCRKRYQDEMLTLALWRQMWPGLRRDFLAITNSGDGTVPLESSCMLRFVRDRATMPVETDPYISSGINCLDDDLPLPGPTPLRSFIARYAIESKVPRRMAASLANIWEDQRRPAFTQLKKLREMTDGNPLPRLTRHVLTHGVTQVEQAEALIDLVRIARDENLDVDLSPIIELASHLSLRDLRTALDIARSATPDSFGSTFYAGVVEHLPLDAIVDVARDDERLPMAKIRRELLSVSSFWPASDDLRAALIALITPSAADLHGLVAIFGESIGPNAMVAIMALVDKLPLSEAASLLHSQNHLVRHSIAFWFASSPDRMQSLVGMKGSLDRQTVILLASALIHGDLPPRAPDTWAALINDALQPENTRPAALNVIGFICALATRSEESYGLACSVFDPLDQSIRNKKLSGVEEKYLTKFLATLSSSRSPRKALVQATLTRWPLNKSNIKAFGITRSAVVHEEIVDEILIRNNADELKRVLDAPGLPEHARDRMVHRLKAPKTPKSANPWWWLFGE
ncbi:hypothetical protein [Novosphingobium sp. B-7]|uniref:GAP1-N1 domain-containing protein n=1 Tax=Novosphingobium sp. B-7 TaxID=1298855 RepID=UPI0003FECAF8|nr:hypothetical protein [Novosphingobium sp. B-7]